MTTGSFLILSTPFKRGSYNFKVLPIFLEEIPCTQLERYLSVLSLQVL